MKRKVILCCLLGAMGVAIACTVIPAIQTPVVQINGGTLEEEWHQIGNKLESMYGDSLKSSEIYKVSVPVSVCVWKVCGPAVISQFLKPCDETMKEAADGVAENAADDVASSGGGGTPPGEAGWDSGGSEGSGTISECDWATEYCFGEGTVIVHDPTNA